MKSRKWIEEYRRTIGGSRAAAIVGKSPWLDPAQAYDEMSGNAPPVVETPDMLRGTIMEPIAAKMFTRETGIKIKRHPQNQFVYNETLPWAHALPDAVVANNPSEGVEIKIPRPATWQRYVMSGTPDHYQVQVQHQMAVVGWSLVHFVALCPVTMQVLHQEIKRDPGVISDIMDAESRFYDALKRGERPAEDARPVIELPEVTGTITIIQSEAAIAAAQAYLECRALREEAEAIEKDAREKLTALTDADAFEIHGSVSIRCYNRLQPGRTTFDSKRALKDDPTLSRYQKQGDPFRSFRAYILGGR